MRRLTTAGKRQARKAAHDHEQQQRGIEEFGRALNVAPLSVRLRYSWLAVTRARKGGYVRTVLVVAAILALAAWGLGDLIGDILY
jgi:hypothetical protein